MAMPRTVPAMGEWSVEDVLRLPEDGNRYEVVGGVLFVTPSPRLVHQDAVGALYRRLHACVAGSLLGWVLQSPADIVFGPRDLVQPDLFVAPLVEGRRPRDWGEVKRLLLAAEVLSPATASQDRREKRRLYQRHSDEYWIVDPDARLIERWRPEDARPEVLDEMLVWRPAGCAEPFSFDVQAFFREVWAE